MINYSQSGPLRPSPRLRTPQKKIDKNRQKVIKKGRFDGCSFYNQFNFKQKCADTPKKRNMLKATNEHIEQCRGTGDTDTASLFLLGAPPARLAAGPPPPPPTPAGGAGTSGRKSMMWCVHSVLEIAFRNQGIMLFKMGIR